LKNTSCRENWLKKLTQRTEKCREKTVNLASRDTRVFICRKGNNLRQYELHDAKGTERSFAGRTEKVKLKKGFSARFVKVQQEKFTGQEKSVKFEDAAKRVFGGKSAIQKSGWTDPGRFRHKRGSHKADKRDAPETGDCEGGHGWPKTGSQVQKRTSARILPKQTIRREGLLKGEKAGTLSNPGRILSRPEMKPGLGGKEKVKDLRKNLLEGKKGKEEKQTATLGNRLRFVKIHDVLGAKTLQNRANQCGSKTEGVGREPAVFDGEVRPS